MDSTYAYIYDGSATPAEQVNLSTGGATYLNTDFIGSVRGVISAAGNLTATTAYDAWGNPAVAGGLTSYTPFGFAGGYADSTGLIYLINRYYDPATGQFISVDPEVAHTQQRYAYADGDPVIQTDPTGQFTFNVPLARTCYKIVCWTGSLLCVSGTLGCSVSWSLTFSGIWREYMIMAPWSWELAIDGHVLGSPGTYNHSEVGAWLFKGSFGKNPVQGQGYYPCGGKTCRLTPWDAIVVGASGAAVFENKAYYWGTTVTWPGES